MALSSGAKLGGETRTFWGQGSIVKKGHITNNCAIKRETMKSPKKILELSSLDAMLGLKMKCP